LLLSADDIFVVNDALGWGGWIIYALLPLSFWVFMMFLLVVVFGRGATVQVPEPEAVASKTRDSRTEPNALGWRPPVPSHR